MRSLATTLFPLAAAVSIGSACYHATIDAGRPVAADVISEPWASSFVFGLVPPKTVETVSRCTTGIARVETQHSFLNLLVGAVTLGIYTPMTITVTCALPRTTWRPAPGDVHASGAPFSGTSDRTSAHF